MKTAADTSLQGILAVTDEPLVSIDFNHDSHSSTVAIGETRVQGDDFVRVLSWYDNEWGFPIVCLTRQPSWAR